MGKDAATTSAFAKDKLFGKRIDEEFAEGQHFLLLGGMIEPDKIETEIGEAELAKLLVQRLDANDQPLGRPYVVGTLASAIVAKVKELQASDVPAIVEVRTVLSKRWKAKALVLQYVGSTDENDVDEIAGKFGVDLAEVARAVDGLRPEADRMPAGF